MPGAFELGGVVVPLVSPLNEDEDIDVAAVSRLVEFHRNAGTNALFLLGTCGEGACLTDAAKMRMIDAVLAERGDLPVMVGVSETATRRAALWAGRAAKAGVDALVVLPPTFQFAMTAAEYVAHIRAVAGAVDLPVVAYNLPKKTGGMAIPVQAVRTLVSEGTIVGIKDSSGDVDNIRAMVRLRTEYPDFRVMNGDLKTVADALRAGVDGVVLSYANVDPAACRELLAAAGRGDDVRVDELQAELNDVWQSFPPTSCPAARAKAILAAMGLCDARACGPSETLEPVLPEPIEERPS